MSLISIIEISGQHGLTHIATQVNVALPLVCVASVIWATHAS